LNRSNAHDLFLPLFQADLSSDDNHLDLLRSSSLTHRYSVKTVTHSSTITDEDASEINDIFDQTLSNLPSTTTAAAVTCALSILSSPKCIPLSSQSSRTATPTLSTSSQSSEHNMTVFNNELISLPADLEQRTFVKHHVNQLGENVDESCTIRLECRLFVSGLVVDVGVNGCVVRSIDDTLPCGHSLTIGDYIVSINDESMRHVTDAQAQAIIRRASMTGSDIR
jgi:hypothetical protein